MTPTIVAATTTGQPAPDRLATTADEQRRGRDHDVCEDTVHSVEGDLGRAPGLPDGIERASVRIPR